MTIQSVFKQQSLIPQPTIVESTLVPDPQTPLKIQQTCYPVPVLFLKNNPEIYLNFPKYQRAYGAWGRPLEKGYIAHILCNLPTGNFTTVLKEGKYYIYDGKQRSITLDRFLHNEFRTPTENQFHKLYPKTQRTIPYNVFFCNMPEAIQQEFLNYQLLFAEVKNATEEELLQNFLDTQKGKSLTVADNLAVYPSLANSIAEDLTHHKFFGEIYRSRRRSKNTSEDIGNVKHHMALYCLAIELFGFPANLSKQVLERIAQGEYDEAIENQQMIQKDIEIKLNMVCHLFAGTIVKAHSIMIYLYECASKLDKAGYSIYGSPAGCLTHWLDTHKHHGIGIMSWGKISNMVTIVTQQDFWKNYEYSLLTLPGLMDNHGNINPPRPSKIAKQSPLLGI